MENNLFCGRRDSEHRHEYRGNGEKKLMISWINIPED